MGFSFADILGQVKKNMPKDLDKATPEELLGALSSLKDLANNVSEDMNKNASQQVKDKYSDGFDALNNMIDKGMENPGEIDTEGLDEYISAAKASKKVKKNIDIEE